MTAPASQPSEPAGMRGLRIEIAPKTIFLILGVIAGVWLLGQLTTVLTVLLVALILVGTFEPVVAWLEQRGLKRGRALVLVFAVATLALALVVLLMIPPLISQLLDVIADLPKMRERVEAWLDGHRWAAPISKALKNAPLDNFGKQAGGIALDYSGHLLSLLGYGVSTLFLAIYLLVDPIRSKGLIYALVPRQRHVKTAKILLELKTIVGGYMRGQLITSLAIALFVFALLSGFNADNALAIALFAGLTDIIPFVGGYVASAPVVLAVTPHGTTATVIMIGVMILYQEFESRILVPRVYGRTLRLPPAIVLIALLVGGTVAGILGALLSLPIAAGLQMLIRELHVELPGEAALDGEARQLDAQATAVYEHLTEGFPAADAGSIAEDLASMVKRTEQGGPRLSAQIPVVSAEVEAGMSEPDVEVEAADTVATALQTATPPPRLTTRPL